MIITRIYKERIKQNDYFPIIQIKFLSVVPTEANSAYKVNLAVCIFHSTKILLILDRKLNAIKNVNFRSFVWGSGW